MPRHNVIDPRPGQKNIDLVGEVFGSLTVIEYSHNNKYNNKVWLCVCECGEETTATTTALRRGSKISCGCRQYRKGKNVYNYTGYEDITGTKWNSIRTNAIKRRLEFNIDKEDVWRIFITQDKKCAISGLGISFVNNTASVDRIDNTLGYTKDNIQLVHKNVNLMRNKFSLEYFVQMCKIITEHNV